MRAELRRVRGADAVPSVRDWVHDGPEQQGELRVCTRSILRRHDLHRYGYEGGWGGSEMLCGWEGERWYFKGEEGRGVSD